jgi:hypothetical protein
VTTKESTDDVRLYSLSNVLATFLKSESKKSALRFDPTKVYERDVGEVSSSKACLAALELSTRREVNEYMKIVKG